jgi:hypothetical protein
MRAHVAAPGAVVGVRKWRARARPLDVLLWARHWVFFRVKAFISEPTQNGMPSLFIAS